ncbi:hypothetical protein GX51_02509 [Blastomyces parvus]|uniref:FHA domain-containing protein n=1 Tax=Blastomyces parvus TaxID=2060905 RepID=A0A2B7XBL2_9EURO|nr:hypothetical protein GX51_02509 [Blastomyces parvus]
MDNQLEFPPWSLREVTLMIVCHDDQAFLRANPSAVHPSLTPHDTWYSGVNPDNEVQAPSNPSQADTDIPGTHPAVLLLRDLPRNGGAYMFGRESPLEPDVKFRQSCISKRHLCVYPDLIRRTWIIQALSPQGAKVNGCRIGSEGVGLPSRRALQYDCLNRVVVAENEFSPGVIFYIKPVWPSDSNYIHWSWQDPNLPELAALNLSWTRTTPAFSQSEILWPGQTHAQRFCLLERRLCDDIELFYAQDLEAGTMLLAEKCLSEREAREQLSWRIRHMASAHDHLLRPGGLHFFDYPYILTSCPFHALPLAELLDFEQRDDRTTYALFEGILSTLHSLFKGSVAGVDITSSNILIEDLHPESPQFWLTGLSSARPLPEDEIEESHSADVKATMRIFTEGRENDNYFQHPVANSTFNEFLETSQSGPVSARVILDKFATLSQTNGDYRFSICYLTAKIAVNKLQSCGLTYYHKLGIARVASALFSETVEQSENAYNNVLCTKSRYTLHGYEGNQLLHREEVHKLFERLGKSPAYDFGLPEKTWISKGTMGEVVENMEEICVSMQISCHAPSNMWNIPQLIHAVRPVDPLDIRDPEFAVEVGGDADCEGFYVDFNCFENACRLLKVIPPAQFPKTPGDRQAKNFISASNQDDNVLVADKKLLGAAIIKRSSRIMHHCGTEFSEDEALEQFPKTTFEGLHRAFSQSGCPPYNLELMCRGQPGEEFPESQCKNITESHSSSPRSFSTLRARRIAGRPHSKARVAQWISEQATRRRRSGGE